jgi:hypothetical protein
VVRCSLARVPGPQAVSVRNLSLVQLQHAWAPRQARPALGCRPITASHGDPGPLLEERGSRRRSLVLVAGSMVGAVAAGAPVFALEVCSRPPWLCWQCFCAAASAGARLCSGGCSRYVGLALGSPSPPAEAPKRGSPVRSCDGWMSPRQRGPAWPGGCTGAGLENRVESFLKASL